MKLYSREIIPKEFSDEVWHMGTHYDPTGVYYYPHGTKTLLSVTEWGCVYRFRK